MEYVMGSALLRLEGELSAAALTHLAEQVALYQVKRVAGGVLVRVALSDVYRLRHLLRGMGIRMRVLRRRGLPFLRVRLRRTAPFAVCLAAALLVLWGICGTVMSVEVTGVTDEPTRTKIFAALCEMGVERGVFTGEIKIHAVEEGVMARVRDLSFVSLKKKGMQLELHAVRAQKVENGFEGVPSVDVVASSPGLVTNVTVFSGTALVRPGDTVLKGQILIRGANAKGLCHADGIVLARVWQRGVGSASLLEEERTPTGRSRSYPILRIGETTLPLFAPEEEYAQYDIARSGGLVPGRLFVPLQVERVTQHEVVTALVPRDQQQVKRQAAQRALTDALTRMPGSLTVVDKRLEYSNIKNEKLLAAVMLELHGPIGKYTEGATALIQEDPSIGE